MNERDVVGSWENSARITDDGVIELSIGGGCKNEIDILRVTAKRMLDACGRIAMDVRCLTSGEIDLEIADMEKSAGSVVSIPHEK